MVQVAAISAGFVKVLKCSQRLQHRDGLDAALLVFLFP